MSEIIASTYEIIGKIGAGGGGNVFLANHLRLDKKVVLKADKRKLNARPDLLRREVDILKELSHSYIPQVYDFFVENETVYTVMDYIEGESLDRPLKRGERFSQPQVIEWARQLLKALCYLHSPIHGEPPRGFVHSDIKPANLMRTPYNDICLIDFNIALALGEENVIGCSAGYASPEHYGLDYSSGSGTATVDNETVVLGDDTATLLMAGLTASSTSKRTVMPDVRSDIYSVGATLYHLLSGKRPSRNAMDVVPLSEKEFSPQIVKIISKAMNPNPDLRYQTAEEMLFDFSHLYENDSRVQSLKRNRRVSFGILGVLMIAGICISFIGLKRMQTTETWLKLAEYSQNALSKGDSVSAIDYALQALPQNDSILTPVRIAEPQKALVDVLGVYDLSDGYKVHKTVSMPSAPLYLAISPDGRSAACVYAYSMDVFDTETAEIMVTLPVLRSALSEVHYLNNDIIIYAGDKGISAYNISTNTEIWTGKPATAISISGDGKTIVAICKDEGFATIYDAISGQIKRTIDFKGRHQSTTVNDNFANPGDNFTALNYDGSLLGVSFDDGSLQIYDLANQEKDTLLLDEASGYTHFEGGFYEQYFAFCASNSNSSIFVVMDTNSMEQTGGFESEKAFSVQTDADGIYVQTENVLAKIHPVSGEQIPLVTTVENILCFAHSSMHTLIAAEKQFMFFDSNANLTSSYRKDYAGDLLQIAEETALIGSSDSPDIRIMKYENYQDLEVFFYDASYEHDEARISADGKTLMLFSYDQFRLYDVNGKLLNEIMIPDAEQVYDQQFIRDEKGSRLEVIYNDGTKTAYDAKDGLLLYENEGEKPDMTFDEEFYTDQYRIESPLHGTPKVYDLESGDLVRELNEDAYLTYVTQTGDYIITQYVTTDGDNYGLLLNQQCEVLAYLPDLCDVMDEQLFFDYSTGDVRKSHIYDIEELITIAQNEMEGTES